MRAAGQLLAGRYRVVRRLGSGGAGAVLLAHDVLLDRDVAVKVLHPSADSATGRRIQREARLGAGLQHPNLVTVYDVVVEDDVLMLVMEYVPGDTLAAVLERGPLAPEQALAVLRPLGDVLDFVHDRGVVHRDVKPPNVLLRKDDRIKLADLGIAAAEDVSRITHTGGVLGTLAYMAPEQLEGDGRAVTPAVDVFALAAVAFETLAGRRARRGTTTIELFAAATNAPPPDLREDRPDLPTAAADVVRRGMARDPAQRPASAGALVAELEAALDPAPPAPVPAPEPVTARAPVVARAPAPPPARPAPRPASRPVARPARRRPRVALLAPVALAGAVLAVVLALALGGGDGPTGDGDGTGAAQRTGATTTPSTAETSPPRTAPPARAGAAPDNAVRALYTRAAAQDLDGAWALAGDGLRAQLGGRSSFDATFDTLRSVRFERLDVTAQSGATATVALQTVARHTTFTDRCSGTAQAVRPGDAGWRVAAIAVDCSRS